MKPREIVNAFKSVGLQPQYKIHEWLNIARPDGVHVEFYPCGPKDEVFTATYTLDGHEQTFDFYMPDDLDLFVSTVCKILKHRVGAV
jgi:hypothetical protein